MKVIVFTNSNGTISITVPTGELSIEEVQQKDTPKGSVIVDESSLPQGKATQYMESWELDGSTINVNLDKAKIIALSRFNRNALEEAQTRQLNTLAGIENTSDDTTWKLNLEAERNKIKQATSINELP